MAGERAEGISEKIILGIAAVAIIGLLGWGGISLVDLKTAHAAGQAKSDEKFDSIDNALSDIRASMQLLASDRYTGDSAARDRATMSIRIDEILRSMNEISVRTIRTESDIAELKQWRARLDGLLERDAKPNP